MTTQKIEEAIKTLKFGASQLPTKAPNDMMVKGTANALINIVEIMLQNQQRQIELLEQLVHQTNNAKP